jgi:hypothetical protein
VDKFQLAVYDLPYYLKSKQRQKMDNQNITKSRSSKDRRREVVDRRLALNKSHSVVKSPPEFKPDDQAQESLEGKSFVDRRARRDRRKIIIDRRLQLDRRRGPGRRRSDERREAEEGQMSDEQFEFVMAINDYKKQNTRPFPTWTEVLEVMRALGYRKVAEPQPLKPFKKEEPFSNNGQIS